MPTQTELDRALAAIREMDAATTSIGQSTTNISARIQRLLDKIAAAPTLEAAKALADEATTVNAKLAPLAAALAPMGHDPEEPVPVDPPPVEPPAPPA